MPLRRLEQHDAARIGVCDRREKQHRARVLAEDGAGDDPTDAAEDPTLVFDLTEQVRETIQGMLHNLLLERPDPYL